MDLMSRTDLFDRLLALNCALTEREAAGMARNLLLAVRRTAAPTWQAHMIETCTHETLAASRSPEGRLAPICRFKFLARSELRIIVVVWCLACSHFPHG